jgi:hypothetical protein
MMWARRNGLTVLVGMAAIIGCLAVPKNSGSDLKQHAKWSPKASVHEAHSPRRVYESATPHAKARVFTPHHGNRGRASMDAGWQQANEVGRLVLRELKEGSFRTPKGGVDVSTLAGAEILGVDPSTISDSGALSQDDGYFAGDITVNGQQVPVTAYKGEGNTSVITIGQFLTFLQCMKPCTAPDCLKQQKKSIIHAYTQCCTLSYSPAAPPPQVIMWLWAT